MRPRLLLVAAAVAVAAYGVAGMDGAPAGHATGPCRSLDRPHLPRLVPAALAGRADLPRFTDVRPPPSGLLLALQPVYGNGPVRTVCLVTRGGHDQLMVVTEHIEPKYYGVPPAQPLHDATCVEFVDAVTHDRHASRCF